MSPRILLRVINHCLHHRAVQIRNRYSHHARYLINIKPVDSNSSAKDQAGLVVVMLGLSLASKVDMPFPLPFAELDAPRPNQSSRGFAELLVSLVGPSSCWMTEFEASPVTIFAFRMTQEADFAISCIEARPFAGVSIFQKV